MTRSHRAKTRASVDTTPTSWSDPTARQRRWSIARGLSTLAAMQMIERPWGIAVYGTASVKTMPDLVRIRFKVVRLEQSPSDSFAAANDAVRAVRQALREHEIADGAVERSRLDLKSMWDFAQERRFLGYQCQASFAVASANLDDVQQLLVDVVAAGANEIESVDFDVRAKADLRAGARRDAVVAARRKAEVYAEAAGVRVGVVLHIDDVDADNPAHQPYRSHSSFAGNGSGQDLAPGHVVVAASVLVGFAINQS